MAEVQAPRQFHPRCHPLRKYNTEKKFRRRYRLEKGTVIELAELFGNSQFAPQGSTKAGGLSHVDRVCLALRFLSSGALYSAVGDTQNVDASTVCRSVDAFVKFMNTVKSRFVCWPEPEEYGRLARDFFEIAGFPRVIAAIDGTHIAIKRPTIENNNFWCRKQFHSVNVLAACKANMEFTYINAWMPGSSHDTMVLYNSALHADAMTGGFGHYVMLGDSGYPLRPFLLTPILRPATDAERSYNRAQIKTRGLIERSFGILKQRFRVLDSSSGYIMSSPDKASLIIMACVCLHNIAIQRGQELDIADIDGDDEEEEEEEPIRGNGYQDGVAQRNYFVANYF